MYLKRESIEPNLDSKHFQESFRYEKNPTLCRAGFQFLEYS